VRVLLDENLPHDLASELVGHDVATVQRLGWAGIKNGELLQRATDKIDAFLTMDRNIEHQQKVGALPFGIVLIRAQSNRMQDLRPLVNDILGALGHVEAGKIQRVGA
jgi:predicted nuclease of predicted toxin-antitoxin system